MNLYKLRDLPLSFSSICDWSLGRLVTPQDAG